MVILQTGITDIIDNADSKTIFGFTTTQFLEDARHHARRKFFTGKSVAATNNFWHRGTQSCGIGLAKLGDHIQVERFSGGARLLGTIQHGNVLYALWQRRQEMFSTKRPEQTHRQNADLLLLLLKQNSGHGFRGLHTGAHKNDDAFGVGRAVIIEQLILATNDSSEPIHFTLHDTGHGGVERVDGFARLKVGIWILRRTPHHRMVWI